MWQWVDRGNIQQISYIPQTKQQAHAVLSGKCNFYKISKHTDTPKITLYTCSIGSTL